MKTNTPQPTHRQNCPHCRRPQSHCYCSLIRKVDSQIKFVILIHHLEAKRKIATGRMAHLCLKDSVLIRGDDFTHNAQVNQLLANPDHHCLLLYPSADAIDLSHPETRANLHLHFPQNKKLVIFVIDGTWSTAKKTVRLSENLKTLPTICFTPKTPSQFRVRKQPAPGCYSTIEAIHHILDLTTDLSADNAESRPHDLLITLFQHMVEQQVLFGPKVSL